MIEGDQHIVTVFRGVFQLIFLQALHPISATALDSLRKNHAYTEILTFTDKIYQLIEKSPSQYLFNQMTVSLIPSSRE
jgi:hypothetical protein